MAACALAPWAPLVAAAQPSVPAPVPLVVQRAPAAADCIDAAALADRVTVLTGRKALIAADGAGSGFAFEVQILKSDEGYTAIVLAGGKSRQISDPGPTCASLSDALSLTLAILVDADATPAPPPPPPPPAPKPTAPAPTFTPPPPPRPTVTRGAGLLISPSVGLSEGLSGSLVPALVLVNDLRLYKSLSVLAGFTWMPSQDFPIGPGKVEVQLMYGQIAPCLSTWNILHGVRLGGCLQLNVGGLRGKAVDIPQGIEVTRPWVSLGLTALLDVPVIDPFYWSVRLSGFGTFTQESFTLVDYGRAFDAPPVGVLVGTGIGVRIY